MNRVDARLAFHSRTPWYISKVLFLMQKYNLFQYTPNISNYNEHWNRPHVHISIYSPSEIQTYSWISHEKHLSLP